MAHRRMRHTAAMAATVGRKREERLEEGDEGEAGFRHGGRSDARVNPGVAIFRPDQYRQLQVAEAVTRDPRSLDSKPELLKHFSMICLSFSFNNPRAEINDKT